MRLSPRPIISENHQERLCPASNDRSGNRCHFTVFPREYMAPQRVVFTKIAYCPRTRASAAERARGRTPTAVLSVAANSRGCDSSTTSSRAGQAAALDLHGAPGHRQNGQMSFRLVDVDRVDDFDALGRFAHDFLRQLLVVIRGDAAGEHQRLALAIYLQPAQRENRAATQRRLRLRMNSTKSRLGHRRKVSLRGWRGEIADRNATEPISIHSAGSIRVMKCPGATPFAQTRQGPIYPLCCRVVKSMLVGPC